MRKLSTEEILEAIDLNKNGWKLHELAREFGVSCSCMWNYFQAFGHQSVIYPTARPTITPEAKCKKVVHLYTKRKMTMQAIAPIIGVNLTTVRNILIRNNVKRRTRSDYKYI